jgi:tetratricopeptide (TPR) repeat protein
MRGRVGMGVAAVVTLCTGSAAAQPAASAVDKPAFTATPAELLATARAAAPSADWPVVVLRDDAELTLDDQGRGHRRWRRVFVVKGQAGVDGWGTWGFVWSPFYQDKPTIRARVIEPDGKVTDLDQKLIVDMPLARQSATVYSDRRSIEAPLPRLRVGVVVEEELVVHDREPALAAGDVTIFGIGHDVPTQSTRIVLTAPNARKVRPLSRNLPAAVKPKHELNRGREQWTFALGPLAPVREREAFAPGDVVEGPYVALTAAASWSAVARAYRKVIDAQLAAKPFALPAELPRTPTIETVRAITAWLHRHIRYTGIEFGQAAYVPWPPGETVGRGFGDCKDKAALLIAMLRQTGIRADLALLSEGPGADVIRDLPGIDVFDHAIVRARVGSSDVWIDATEDLILPGRLPSRDQGRLALVIADDTADLVATPVAPATDNMVREVRTFELAEQGPATRITEVSRQTGVFDASARSWLRDTATQDLRKQLATYAESEYAGAKLDRHAASAVDDLTKPIEITVVATGSERALTHRGELDVYLFATDTLENVPELLRVDPDKAEPRHDDFVWYRPHVYEIENRLVLPPGYAAPSDPITRERNLGTAKLIERRRLDGNTLVVTFRFESGKPRLTPKELAILQRELHALRDDSTHLVIEHTGWSLAARGKYREAITEIERLVRTHPKEALHQTQLAYAYIEAGMGDAARRAARQATQLEPTNADAHVMLGWVLTHDTFGRRYAPGNDRAGALAAFAKAHVLDPKHVGATVEYAELLERGSRGALYDRGSDVKAAAEAWRVVRTLDDTPDHRLSHARALFAGGDLANAEKVLRDMQAEKKRDELLVATLAAGKGGVRAALAAADGLRSATDKPALLEAAIGVLYVNRYYDAMRALLAQAPQSAQARNAAMFQKLVRNDKPPRPGTDPRATVLELVQLPFEPTLVTSTFWDAQTDTELRPGFAFSAGRLPELGTQLLIDTALAVTDLRIDGSPTGWRVEIDAMGNKSAMYLALDRGIAKVIATREHPAGVGRHAQRLLARRDVASAQRLLDWLRSDLSSGATNEQAKQFLAIWAPGAPRDAGQIAIAGAVLAATDASSVPVLTKCESSVTDAREICDVALAAGYVARDQWRELEAHTARWLTRKRDPVKAPFARAVALFELGQLDAAEKQLDALLAVRPDFDLAHRLRVSIALARGNPAEAIKRYAPLLQNADAAAYNDLAWLYVTEGQDLKIAVDLARKAVGNDKARANANALNTLALIETELGDLGAAKADEWAAMERRPRGMDPSDWYTIGRIAEQLGLRDDAIAAYRKIVPVHGPQTSRSSYELAQRRLQKLGVKTK